MKCLFALGFLLLTLESRSFAAPDMTASTGTQDLEVATVVPDHDNPNLYYVFPQSSNVALKANGKQDFLYMEDRNYGWRHYTVESATLTVGIKINVVNPDLDAKMKQIRAQNPKATFTIVNFTSSKVTVDNSIKEEFLDSSCDQVAGPVEVPVYCSMNINPMMSYAFRHLIALGPVRVLQYTYQFYGWANGKTDLYTHTVPLTVGDLNEPTYFVDQAGVSVQDNTKMNAEKMNTEVLPQLSM